MTETKKCKYLMIDIDVSSKILLNNENTEETVKELILITHNYALEIQQMCNLIGIDSYIEDSGYRGRHIWIFFDKLIQSKDAQDLGKIIISKLEKIHQDISIEVFPNQIFSKNKTFGQRIKLPFSIHYKTNKRSFFVDSDSKPYSNQVDFIKKIRKNSLSNVKKILLKSIKTNSNSNEIIFKNEDISSLTVECEVIKILLEKCEVVRYLVIKAKKSKYLIHGERMSLLLVLGHLGENGISFLHKVMGYTINYNRGITDGYIRTIPAKPIGCSKLKRQYSEILKLRNCNCYFKLVKKCYPSPVLHCVSMVEDKEITLPVIKNVAKPDKSKILLDVNLRKEINELATSLINNNKRLRAIQKEIKNSEDKLSVIFDNMKVEEFEIDFGILKRERIDNVYDWIVDI